MTRRKESKREKQKAERHVAAPAPVSDTARMKAHLLKYPAFEGPVAEIVSEPVKKTKKRKKA